MRKYIRALAVILLFPTVVSAGAMKIEFTDTSTKEDGFYIQRSLTELSADFTTVASLPSSSVTKVFYTDSGLADNQKYCYRVAAYNAAGSSAWTLHTCATTLLGTPTAPTGLTLTPQ